MKNKFNISTFALPRHVIPALKGFDEEVYNSVYSFGLKQRPPNIMDIEFVTNMGTLLTGLSYMATHGVEKNVDWRFSQHGILYTTNEKEFTMYNRTGRMVNANHHEFGFAIGMSACQENMGWAIKEGFKNPFRLSYFYYNFLDACLDYLPENVLDSKKVREIVLENESINFVPFKNDLEALLDLPVTTDSF